MSRRRKLGVWETGRRGGAAFRASAPKGKLINSATEGA